MLLLLVCVYCDSCMYTDSDSDSGRERAFDIGSCSDIRIARYCECYTDIAIASDNYIDIASANDIGIDSDTDIDGYSDMCSYIDIAVDKASDLDSDIDMYNGSDSDIDSDSESGIISVMAVILMCVFILI